jgi:flagellar biosynthetic protein FliQ
MTPETAIHLIRQAMLTVVLLSAPLLVLGFLVGVAVNIIQVATSLQDTAFSTLPRLAAFVIGILIVLPWMFRQLITYTTLLISSLPQYVR